MVFQPGKQKTGGRAAGTQNKATQEARRAIADFVDGNAHRLQEWLDKIADGVWDEKKETYVKHPDPEKAFSLFQSVIEYHVPKLQRTTLDGDPDKPIQNKLTVEFVDIKHD